MTGSESDRPWRAKGIQPLLDFWEQVEQQIELDDVALLTIKAAAKLLEADAACLSLVGSATGGLQQRWDTPGLPLAGAAERVIAAAARQAHQGGKAVRLDPADTFPESWYLVCVPLVAHANRLGALLVARAHGPFSNNAEKSLQLLAGHAGTALLRARRLRWIRYAFQNARIEMHFYRARIALARASTGDRAYLRIAERDASRLEHERAAWATALAALVRGSVRATSGDSGAAIDGLLAAERALRDVAMAHYAAAAQYRRGQLVGGDEGRAQITAATEWFKEQEVVNIERMVCLLAPGDWRHVSDAASHDRTNL